MPLPPVFDVEGRIKRLKEYLDIANPTYQRPEQHVNIRAAIRLYENGELDGIRQVEIMNGKIVTQKAALESLDWVWLEVSSSNLFTFRAQAGEALMGNENDFD
ncbi:MAG: hypothetical protein M1837_000158 [Sclerophora amabilis]|nr:MAG: hypothetical protein M1837_000158 [Sclerophora amabilis]